MLVFLHSFFHLSDIPQANVGVTQDWQMAIAQVATNIAWKQRIATFISPYSSYTSQVSDKPLVHMFLIESVSPWSCLVIESVINQV